MTTPMIYLVRLLPKGWPIEAELVFQRPPSVDDVVAEIQKYPVDRLQYANFLRDCILGVKKFGIPSLDGAVVEADVTWVRDDYPDQITGKLAIRRTAVVDNQPPPPAVTTLTPREALEANQRATRRNP